MNWNQCSSADNVTALLYDYKSADCSRCWCTFFRLFFFFYLIWICSADCSLVMTLSNYLFLQGNKLSHVLNFWAKKKRHFPQPTCDSGADDLQPGTALSDDIISLAAPEIRIRYWKHNNATFWEVEMLINSDVISIKHLWISTGWWKFLLNARCSMDPSCTRPHVVYYTGVPYSVTSILLYQQCSAPDSQVRRVCL